MDRIEEVKKIHEHFEEEWDKLLDTLPDCSGRMEFEYDKLKQQYYSKICQLFEPHDEAMETELAWRKRKVIGEEPSGNSLFEIKPISNAQTGEGIMSNAPKPDEGRLLTEDELAIIWLNHSKDWEGEIAKAQDAKTVSICKAHEQERVERIKREIERKGLGSYMGTISLTAGEWQALWKE